MSSPVEILLPDAHYCIWAGKPGDLQELTDVVKVRLEGEEKKDVELLVQ